MAAMDLLQDALQPIYLEIEANYTIKQTAALATRLWYVPLVSCVLYLAAVYLGTSWMSGKTPYTLRPLLVLWNLALTVLSVVGAYVMVPDLYRYIFEKGYIASVCTTAIHHDSMLSFWSLIFVFSKIFEFGDTFFIIARKAPLRFLHWYHHVTVCVFSWYSISIQSSVAHWYCAMNYLVHSFMYSYYLLKACRVFVPTLVATCITLLQLVQFMLGLVATVVASQQYWSGHSCHVDDVQMVLGLLIYGSYLMLFSHFFYERYMKKPSSQKRKEQ